MTAPVSVDPSSSPEARVAAWIAVVALVVGVGFAPPWRGAGGDIPEGFAGRLVAGMLERADGDSWAEVRIGELVPEGADVRTTDGAGLAVPGGRLGLGAGAELGLSEPLELDQGALLLEIEARERQVLLGPILAAGRGIWRVDATGAPRVAVYDGDATVRPADEPDGGLPIGRLHQADLGGALPAATLPLRYSLTDAWDARLLVDALAVDRQAAQLQRSLTAQHGADPRPDSFYRSFAIVDEPVAGALSRFAGEVRDGELGPPAEVLLHVVVVDLLRSAAGFGPEEAIDAVGELRSAGATWGVVLALHHLDAEDLRSGFDLSLRPGARFAAPAPSGPASGPNEPGTPEPPPGEEPPPPSDPPPPPDEPVLPCEGQACDEANDLADDLLDLIDDVLPDGDEDDGEDDDGDDESVDGDDDLMPDELKELRKELREDEKEERREGREGEREEQDQLLRTDRGRPRPGLLLPLEREIPPLS